MTPERWREIKHLFDAALLRKPAERRAFIAEASHGDSELERQVTSLLAALDDPNHPSDVLGLRILIRGSRLGPYEIVSLLGEGGMGEVYSARDTRLDRLVAIKVVKPFVAANAELRGRFEREARAVASLNHPHICTLHDVGTDQGISFFVMEFLEGETLAARLSRGAVSLDEALQYAIQIADALAFAHSHGITHRDLKPANVMLTDRGAKLLDFGIAKLTSVRDATGEPLTLPGRTPGTLRYMAPEQIEGRETDARTDIFAFGAVLYEMVTGRKAFDGLGPLTPASLERLVRRCLERSPDDRWQSCQDLRSELRHIADRTGTARTWWKNPLAGRAALTAAAAAAIVGALAFAFLPRPGRTVPESVAVLPFLTIPAGADLAYLGSGIADGLTNSLSRIPRLRVTPRTLVDRYAKQDDIEGVARALGVDAVVTGRISQNEDRVTVAVELVDVNERSQLWGAQYQSSPLGVLDIEKTIAIELAGRLRGGADQGVPQAVTEQYSESPEAYQAYLRGQHSMKMGTRDGYTRGLEYFQDAAARDPGYALAYAGVAEAFTVLGYFNTVPPAIAFPNARTAALRALELDSRLGEAHTALASVMLLHDWNFPGAEQHYKTAMSLRPEYPGPVIGYSLYLASQGRLREAITEAVRAAALDPVTPGTSVHVGWMQYFDRNYDGAIEQVRSALDLRPGFAFAYELLTAALVAKGVTEAEMRDALERHGLDPATVPGQIAYLQALRGTAADKQAFLAALKRPISGEAQIPSFTLASIQAMLGDRLQALDSLELAYKRRESQMIWLNANPSFDSLRSEPRFLDLVRRVGLPQ